MTIFIRIYSCGTWLLWPPVSHLGFCYSGFRNPTWILRIGLRYPTWDSATAVAFGIPPGFCDSDLRIQSSAACNVSALAGISASAVVSVSAVVFLALRLLQSSTLLARSLTNVASALTNNDTWLTVVGSNPLQQLLCFNT